MKIKKSIKLSKRLLFTSLAAVALLGATQPVLADINPPYPELLDLGEPIDSGYYTDSSQEPPLLEPPYPGLLENDKDTSERGTNQSNGHDNGDNVHRPSLPPVPNDPSPSSPSKPNNPSNSDTPEVVYTYERGFKDGRQARLTNTVDFSRFSDSVFPREYVQGYYAGYQSVQ
ncbi:hypothetical protein [Streptococcus dysgalactiae]|uniref:hypothetical protein n=1 Tax=Streptococcus dysgalactiae TaxID=1334 RepID=UPI0008247430|nr:hypothetical protein [Streptococcus dysgalactiae]OCX00138.1 hypothetical protein BBG09_09990 [Streptococcus dysgalactiae subsp. equisimilis]